MEKQESNYNMIDWWKKVVLKNYANFQGRARRSEYWYYALFNVILILPFYVIAMIGLVSEITALSIIGGLGYIVILLGTFIPSLAAVVRRLHDVGRSGWYYFIALIPIAGPIILLVWLFTEGNSGANEYGDDPKNPGIPELEFTGQ
jgi:uncharacterized membrane protein YhaH (DUF805 family)